MTKAASKNSANRAELTEEKLASMALDFVCSDSAAITVQATQPAPINQDAQNALAAFTARPAVAAGLSALNATGEGVKLVWEHEQEYHTFRLFLCFVFDGLKAIFAPLFAVLWLAVNKGYLWTRKSETRAAVAAKWQSVKAWAAPKFDYETEADRNSELKLND